MNLLLEKIKKMQCEDYLSLIKIIFSFLPSKLFKRLRQDIWIICEREYDARDNGYWLFKYIRENHPEIDVYYPINFSSPDYLKIKPLGHIIKFGSFHHHLYTWACKKYISAHIGNGLPNGHICYNLLMWNFYSFKNIFLQHGVIENELPFLFKENTKLDLFICSSKKETEYVINNFGYSNDIVKCLGLCRYDQLNTTFTIQNQILIMPTWRCWLYTDQKKDFLQNRETFFKSNYYKQYQALITNPKLIGFAKNNSLNIVFYPHNDMQQFLNMFETKSDNIIVASKNEYDIQTLLKESSLLITDYSSIAFDFAYMKKPLIYFQFDEKEYRSKHYPEGYFNYQNNGFGLVLFKIDDVINSIIKAYENKFQNENEYITRSENFFCYHDNQNCKRNFEAIKNLK